MSQPKTIDDVLQELENDCAGLVKSAQEWLFDDALAYLEDVRQGIEAARKMSEVEGEQG